MSKVANTAALLLAASLAAQVPTPAPQLDEQQVQQLRKDALQADRLPELRCAALSRLQDAGALDVATVVAALGGASAEVADSVAAIVRHEWTQIPAQLLEALQQDPAAALPLARELALAPRSAFVPLAEHELADERVTGDRRCLWLAVRGRPLTLAEAGVVLETLVGGAADDGCHAAFAVLPSLVADALVAKVHGLLLQGKVEVGAVVPWFDRLSDKGRARLLSLAVTLPPAPASEICQYVIDYAPRVYEERAAAALDGEVPLERLWLQRAAPLLDRPARIERVIAVLTDEQASPELRRAAFETLAKAQVADERVLDWVDDSADAQRSPLRRLLDVAVESIPATRLRDWLLSTPEISTAALVALGRRPTLEPELLRTLLAPIEEAGCVAGLWCERAAIVIALRATPKDLLAAWPLLRTHPDFSALAQVLSRRREPEVRELLLGELRAAAPDGVDEKARDLQLAAVRLALVTLGERAQLAQLVAQSPQLSPSFVRRCTALDEPLDVDLARSLIAAARQADEALAAELLAWAARCPAPELVPLWVDVRSTMDGFEAQEIALRALCAGGHRAALVAELRAAITSGQWSDDLDSMRYEIVATMGEPKSAADLQLLAELVLLAPLAEPEAERERAERWPDGSHGFPFVAAIAQALRGADAVAVQAAFDAVMTTWRAHPQRQLLARQGLVVLWRSLEADRSVQRAVGMATCGCFDELPGDVGAGPAAWFAMQRRAEEGRPADAAAAARIAIEHLLRYADSRRDARLFLGERDPAAGVDPWAALAAAPHWFEAQAQRDVSVRKQYLARARDLAGHDRATLDKIDPLMESSR
ncbi:MAG: hypothetical protein H6838_11280 [Planctomycetes bacterium]|nr:hypothetical protein [Planctomycetota bacterium]